MGLKAGTTTLQRAGACRRDARVRHSTCSNATELAAASGSQVGAGRLWTRGACGSRRPGRIAPGSPLRRRWVVTEHDQPPGTVSEGAAQDWSARLSRRLSRRSFDEGNGRRGALSGAAGVGQHREQARPRRLRARSSDQTHCDHEARLLDGPADRCRLRRLRRGASGRQPPTARRGSRDGRSRSRPGPAPVLSCHAAGRPRTR